MGRTKASPADVLRFQEPLILVEVLRGATGHNTVVQVEVPAADTLGEQPCEKQRRQRCQWPFSRFRTPRNSPGTWPRSQETHPGRRAERNFLHLQFFMFYKLLDLWEDWLPSTDICAVFSLVFSGANAESVEYSVQPLLV